MSVVNPTVTQSQVQVVLRAFLLSVLPSSWEVIEGQDSRVSEPTGSYVVLTAISRDRLETNGYSYAPPAGALIALGTLTATQAFRVTFQMDFHSANTADSSDAAVLVSTLFRSDYAVSHLAATGLPVSPLYADDPRQVPFINAEQQYETRWTLDAVMQVNAGITWPQDFMLGAPTVNTPPPVA